MSRNIAFVFSEKDIAEINYKDYDLFPLNSNLKLKFAKNGIEYKVLEDYFLKKNKYLINKKASYWADTWYSGNDQVFKYLALSMHNYFSKILFLITCLDNLMTKHPTNLVFLGNEYYHKKDFLVSDFEAISPLVKLVCAHKNIRIIEKSKNYSLFIKQLVQFFNLPPIQNMNYKKLSDNYVFFSSHHYHILNCLKLLKKISTFSELTPLVIGRIGSIESKLKKENISFINYYGQVEFRSFGNYLYYKFKLLIELFASNLFNKSYIFSGYNLITIFSFKFTSLFLFDGPRLKSTLETYNNLINCLHPKSIVTITNDSGNQAFSSLANVKNIKTFEIQHGLTFGLDSIYSKADTFIAWGSTSAKIYRQTGVKGQNIEICGWPAFEVYKNYKKRILKHKKDFTVLFLAHDPQGMSLPFLTQSVEQSYIILFEALTRFKNINLVIRLHPRADKNIVFSIAERYRVKYMISKNESLLNDLHSCDIAVGQTTAASLDALLLRKPFIYFSSMKFEIPFMEKSRCVIEVSTSRQLYNYLRRFSSGETDLILSDRTSDFIDSNCNFNKNSIEIISKTILKNVTGKK